MEFDMSTLSYSAELMKIPTTSSPDISHSTFSFPLDLLAIDDDDRDFGALERGLSSEILESDASTPNLSHTSTWTSDSSFSPILSPSTESEKQLFTEALTNAARSNTQKRKPIGRSWTNLGLETFAENGKHNSPCADDTLEGDARKHKCEACATVAIETGKRKLERRRAQNRSAQHNYRARQQAQLRESSERAMVLQTQVDALRKRVNDLELKNDCLRARNALLEYGQLEPDPLHASWPEFLSMGQSE